ncbi:MAG: spore coat protein [Clostridia bacterium]|nr:spore coat protein [Clostridia bacterium]MDQ7791197.1 spore coat protein [Clostridia bacterium]
MMNKLDDRDILTDCLEDAKWGSSSYHMAILEAANEPIRNTLLQLHNDELMLQKNIFEMMHQRGFYPVEPAARTATHQQTQTTFKQEPGYQPYGVGFANPQTMHQSMYQANQAINPNPNMNPNLIMGTQQQS